MHNYSTSSSCTADRSYSLSTRATGLVNHGGQPERCCPPRLDQNDKSPKGREQIGDTQDSKPQANYAPLHPSPTSDNSYGTVRIMVGRFAYRETFPLLRTSRAYENHPTVRR